MQKIIDPNKQQAKRERMLFEVARQMDFDVADLDDKSPSEISQAVASAIENKRSERDEWEIAKQVVTVTLGDELIEVRKRPMAEDKDWRLMLGKLFKDAGGLAADMEDEVSVMGALIPYLLSDGFEGLVEAFAEYAKMDYDEITKEYSSAELMEAALVVFESYASPFLIAMIKRFKRLGLG